MIFSWNILNDPLFGLINNINTPWWKNNEMPGMENMPNSRN